MWSLKGENVCPIPDTDYTCHAGITVALSSAECFVVSEQSKEFHTYRSQSETSLLPQYLQLPEYNQLILLLLCWVARKGSLDILSERFRWPGSQQQMGTLGECPGQWKHLASSAERSTALKPWQQVYYTTQLFLLNSLCYGVKVVVAVEIHLICFYELGRRGETKKRWQL